MGTFVTARQFCFRGVRFEKEDGRLNYDFVKAIRDGTEASVTNHNCGVRASKSISLTLKIDQN